MKKITILALSLAACATFASASVISCDVTTGTGYTTGTADINGNFTNTGLTISTGVGAGVITCPTISVSAGSTITNYQVLATGDYTGGPFGTTSGTQVTLAYSSTIGAQNLVVTGGNSSSLDVPPTPFQLGITQSGATSYAGFTVAVTSSVQSGTVGASSAQVVLSYTVSSGVPEPTTLGLVGSALLGLGFLARKRK